MQSLEEGEARRTRSKQETLAMVNLHRVMVDHMAAEQDIII